MFHVSSSRRFISNPLYLQSLNLSFLSTSHDCVSVTHNHHQTNIQQSQITGRYNELLDYFHHLLRKCFNAQHTKQIHTQILLCGGSQSSFLASRLVSVYSEFELLNDARKVFGAVPIDSVSNLLLWNSILRANVRHGEYRETISIYVKMRNLGVRPDGFSFPLIVRACGMMGCLQLCKIVHFHVLQMGFRNNLHVVNELMGMYGKVGRMDVALQLFDRMVARSHLSWNTMVSGYAYNYDCVSALEMFRRMEFEGWEPNLVTWTSLLSSHSRCGFLEETLELYDVLRGKGIGASAESLAVVISVCSDSQAFDKGRGIHGYVIRAGFEDYLFVKHSLLCLYGKHGVVIDAESLFHEIKVKSVVSWNALISSYAESGLCDEAFATFSKMDGLGGYPVARPDIVSWNTVINGFASKGRCEESLELFRHMQLTEVMANSLTISSILSVCAELSALVLGKELHSHVIRRFLDSNLLVGNGLIYMYTKCGSLSEGRLAFEKIDGRDVYSWNTMITGYGMHGLGESALETFNQMMNAGYEPDGVTFVAVLSACSHAGLVSEGRKFFSEMKSKFKIKPEIEHYACMVDLLGRAGFLQEASDTVESMPMQPNGYVWGALLNSCRMHKNTDLAEATASRMLDLDSAKSGSYMLLSNIYAESGRWRDSAKVRILNRTRGLKKIPGQSSIELKKKVHKFSAGNVFFDRIEEVHMILKDLSLQMQMKGYLPQSTTGLLNLDEEDLPMGV